MGCGPAGNPDSVMDPKVKEYIGKQKSPQKEILLNLREIVLRTFPDIKEELWEGAIFYDRKYYLATVGKKVHMGFCVEGLSKDELKLFEGSGKFMRHVKIFSLKESNEKKIVDLMKVVKKPASYWS
jgi:hypothetical protein